MDRKPAYLFMFMGQSNMAGRGISTPDHPEPAPALIPGAGVEYRAVSAPDRLFPIAEPFGYREDRPGGIDDAGMKTGSLVTSFVNAFYSRTGVPVAGVSASKGGSVISRWQPGGAFLTDALSRLDGAVDFLLTHGFVLLGKFLLWSQGESDADIGNTGDAYRRDFTRLLDALTEHGIQRCFLIKTGRYNGPDRTYAPMRELQERIAAEDGRVTVVSRLFESMKSRGLMKDRFHYYQQAYNEVGADAGNNTATYILSHPPA